MKWDGGKKKESLVLPEGFDLSSSRARPHVRTDGVTWGAVDATAGFAVCPDDVEDDEEEGLPRFSLSLALVLRMWKLSRSRVSESMLTWRCCCLFCMLLKGSSFNAVAFTVAVAADFFLTVLLARGFVVAAMVP